MRRYIFSSKPQIEYNIIQYEPTGTPSGTISGEVSFEMPYLKSPLMWKWYLMQSGELEWGGATGIEKTWKCIWQNTIITDLRSELNPNRMCDAGFANVFCAYKGAMQTETLRGIGIVYNVIWSDEYNIAKWKEVKDLATRWILGKTRA